MDTPLIVKILIIFALAAIVSSLLVALLRLNADRGKTERTVRALTTRIVLSLTLFLLLVIGFLAGVIVPHGVAP